MTYNDNVRRDTTPIVDQFQNWKPEGNIIPHVWRFLIVRESTGKPYNAAIDILAEICYWYRPNETVKELSPGNRLIEVTKRFKDDKWQCSYRQLIDALGYSKKQVTEAVHYLHKKGLITMEFRTVKTETTTLSNVLYLEPVFDTINQLGRYPLSQTGDTLSPKREIPSPPNGGDVYKRTHTREHIQEKDVPNGTEGAPMEPQQNHDLFSSEKGESSEPQGYVPKGNRWGRSEPEAPRAVSQKGKKTHPALTGEYWQEYSSAVFHWHGRFKNLSRMRFPGDYDPEMALANPEEYYPDMTKKFKECVSTVWDFTHKQWNRNGRIDPDWASGKFPKATRALNSGSVTLDVLERALGMYNCFFDANVWPEDKKTLSTDLLTVFFHHKTRHSWLIQCLEMMIEGKSPQRLKNNGITDRIRESIDKYDYLWDEANRELLYGTIAEWWPWFLDRLERVAAKDYTDLTIREREWGRYLKPWMEQQWIEEYLDWIAERVDYVVDPQILGSNSKWALGFLRYTGKDMDFDPLFSKEEWNKLS